MKSEPKAFASLSSGLLARKGAARPAMRPQGFGQSGASLEDLGWNDMGFEPPKAAANPAPDTDHDAFGEVIAEMPSRSPIAGLTPVDSPVHGQQAEIAGRLSTYTPDDEGDEVDETAELYEADDEQVEEQSEAVEAFEPEPIKAFEPEPVPAPVVQHMPAPVRRQRSVPRAQAGAKGKTAFTLRLDPQRHLKLRLACAVNGQSAQMLVTQALDQLIAAMPELEAMAEKAKPKG